MRAGQASIGDESRVSSLDGRFVNAVLDRIHAQIEDAIDQMKTSSLLVPVILVGGGNILLSRPLRGTSKVHRPEHADVANAVGAAISMVSGRVDRLFDFAVGREKALEQAKEEARSAAVAAGAEPESIEIVELTELPMTHMRTTAVQVKVRAVGPAACGGNCLMYTISSDLDVRDMARGAVLLGSGGGGDPYVGELYLRNQLTEGRCPTILKASELADDAFVISIAGVGAPTVITEHLVSTRTLLRLLEASEKFYGRKIDALISAEIGGVNSMFPLALGTRAGIPIVDGDGMGRAFPHLEMTTFGVYGCAATPSVLMDDSGNVVHVHTTTNRIAEDVVRSVCASLGSMIFGSFYPMSGRQVKQVTVHDTVTHTLEIGRRIRAARESQLDPVKGVLQFLDSPNEGRYARELFNGRITDVLHETRDGWHWGRVLISSGAGVEPEFRVEIQNEYLVARHHGRTVTIVPDLIAILDAESAEPLTAEMLAYGQRVRVIGYSAAPIMRRPECLKVFGPRLFGIDEDFRPVEELVEAP